MSGRTALECTAAVTPRIETAEILSFRLKVPPDELKRLPQQVGAELSVSLEHDGQEIVLSLEVGDSYLRFRSIGAEAMLTEIFLSNDERGAFFQQVLGPLMVRYAGDLQIRLTWNTPERNSHGDYAEVRISRGSTTYPGLSNALGALPPAGGAEGVAALSDEAELDDLTPLEKEVHELLTRARSSWDEYQRLKDKKGK